MPFFFFVFFLLLLLLMGLSQPKSCNYQEVLINQRFISQELHKVAINICDNNDLNLSQDLADGDDYMNTADLNIYGNIWKTPAN